MVVVIKLYANTFLWAPIMVISTCTKIGTPHAKALAQTEMSLLIFFQMQCEIQQCRSLIATIVSNLGKDWQMIL